MGLEEIFVSEFHEPGLGFFSPGRDRAAGVTRGLPPRDLVPPVVGELMAARMSSLEPRCVGSEFNSVLPDCCLERVTAA